MKDKEIEGLPQAGDQKAIDKKLRELMGPPPQEATEDEILESRGLKKPKLEEPTKVVAKDPVFVEVTNSKDLDMLDDENVEEDSTTSEAVDDIVAKEADTVLESEDAEVAKAFLPSKKGISTKLHKLADILWGNPTNRWRTIIIIFLFILMTIFVPQSRYFLLNTAGVRSSVSLTVLEESSQQPLKNIEVTINGQSSLTDGDGKATVKRVKLGKTTLRIKKRAYAELSKVITIGWGSNPIGNFNLKAVGTQYSFVVKDLLSGLPIDYAEAGVGEAISTADKNGKVLIATDPSNVQNIVITVNAKSYRTEKVSISVDSKVEQVVQMVPARKSVFISKRTGKYDLFKVDVDGKNEGLILKGTGSEQEGMALLSHPADEFTAYVSTRDNARNKDGFLLSTLLIINLGDNSIKSITQSESIKLIGWSGDRLVYMQIVAGASAFSEKRYRIMSYDYKTTDKRELAAGNYFNDTVLVGGVVYYANTGLTLDDGSSNFSKINVDGSGKQIVVNKLVWNIFRSTYEKMTLSVDQDWYDYKIGTTTTTKLAGQPAGLKSFTYFDSPDLKHSLWVEERDGKGVLLAYDTITKTDKALKTQSGLISTVRWLSNNTVVYRIHTSQETADYVLNLDGGEAKKIKDVTNTIGIDQGYY